ncbi:MAG: hypothetical protein IJS52_09745, partial [Bacilli bacterium]|nr:hypothetical protein [Bacilli bacterium]
TDETGDNPHQTTVDFSFQVNNLTDLTIVYGVVNSGDEYECDPNSDYVNRYLVDLYKYGDDSGKTLDTAYSSEPTAIEHKPGDYKATWSWDGSRTDDSTGALRVIMIEFNIFDRHTTLFYIESISFSWSC